MREQEAIIHCPACLKEHFTLYRESTGSSGVWVHVAEPKAAQEAIAERRGKCECGTIVERKSGV